MKLTIKKRIQNWFKVLSGKEAWAKKTRDRHGNVVRCEYSNGYYAEFKYGKDERNQEI